MIRSGDELSNNRARKMSEDTNSVQRKCWNGAVEIRKESCHSLIIFSWEKIRHLWWEYFHCFLVLLKQSTLITSMRPYWACKALVLPCLNSTWLAWSWFFFSYRIIFGRRRIDQDTTANEKLLPFHRHPLEDTGFKMQKMSGRMKIMPGKGLKLAFINLN